MASGYGMRGHIGLAKQTTWGTAVAATDYVEAFSESLSLSLDRFDVKNIYGGMYEPDDMSGVQRIAGDIVIPGFPESIPWILYGATGIQSNTLTVSAQQNTHEFTMATTDASSRNPLPLMTFEIFRDVTTAQQYSDAQISGFQVSVAPNQDARFTASVMAATVTNIAATTPSFPGSPVNPFAFDTASIQIGGAATAAIEALTISVDNQLEGIPTLENHTKVGKFRRTGPQLIRASGQIAFENITDSERFANQTEFAMVAHLTRANSFSMLIELPRCIYLEHPLSMSDRGRQVVSFTAKAEYHTGSASSARFSVTNTRSGY